jgi:hypothetical protein
MAEERTFDDVTWELWERVRAYGERQHGTVFRGASDDEGTATTRTVIGDIVLAYVLDLERGCITYRIERKPIFVAAAQIWDGIGRAIERCRSEV